MADIATDFLIKKHTLNSHHVRVRLQVLARERLPGGQEDSEALPQLQVVDAAAAPSGWPGVVRLSGHQDAWVSHLPVSLDDLEKGWSAFPSGLPPWLNASGFDNLCQGAALHVNVL